MLVTNMRHSTWLLFSSLSNGSVRLQFTHSRISEGNSFFLWVFPLSCSGEAQIHRMPVPCSEWMFSGHRRQGFKLSWVPLDTKQMRKNWIQPVCTSFSWAACPHPFHRSGGRIESLDMHRLTRSGHWYPGKSRVWHANATSWILISLLKI